MKCLVSGATGFIGRRLCQQLTARGHTVLALSKNGASLANGEPTLALDLAKSDPHTGILRGVDVFFHLAGVAHQQASQADYHALNYRATVRLARLASAAGIGCFVFLSSVKAMGFPASPEVRAENACSRPTEAYGLSKWKAEEALREAFSDDPMSIVIVRPALVYGAGVKGNLQHLATAVRWGLPRPPEGGDRSMVAIEDLVELLCIVAQHPPPGIHTWIVCGADNYSTREVYDLLREAAGKGRGGDWLPRWVWWVGACLLDFARGRDGGSTYDKLFGAELYTNAAVLADTRWQPRVRLEDIAARIARVGSSGS